MPIKIEARQTFLWSTPTQSAVISFLEKKTAGKVMKNQVKKTWTNQPNFFLIGASK